MPPSPRPPSPRPPSPSPSSPSPPSPTPHETDPPAEHALSRYQAASGRFEPVWTLEVQTVLSDVDRILDAVMAVHPLTYGNYERNASVSATGMETARPRPGSTTATQVEGFEPLTTETFPVIELKISIERDAEILAEVMDAILDVHHYEEPVIFLREDWVSRSAYNPNNDNPNRWWNNGRGLPPRIVELTEGIT